MTEHTIRSILRILAVTCVTIGTILVIQTIVQTMMMSSITNSSQFGAIVPKLGSQVGGYAIIGQLSVSLVGLVLYLASDLIATKIVGET